MTVTGLLTLSAAAPGIIAESDLSGATKSEYIFFAGERVARRDGVNGTGGVFYYFSDHLKTASVITDATGTIKAESDYYPWGGELQLVNADSNHYKFTGKERDTETGLDYFGARYYSNGLGRWVSADWSAAPIPVPYADFGDPQTLNLNTYVRNIPTSKIDVDGHCYPVCTVLVGAGMGALTGGGGEFIRQKIRGEKTDWSRVRHAAAGGAVAGAIGGLAGPGAGLAAKAGIAALGSVTGGGVERKLNGEKVVNAKAIVVDAVAGGIAGTAEKGLEKAIPHVHAGVTKVDFPGGGFDATFRTEAGAATENVVRNAVRTTVNTVGQTTNEATKDLIKDHTNEKPPQPAQPPPPPEQPKKP